MATCTIVPLPAAKADFCNPTLNYGQIDEIRIGNFGEPFTDWTSPTEWGARVDNADVADPTKIRQLNGIGDKPAADAPETAYSRGRTLYGTRTHTINFKIDEVFEENYALLRFIEANPGQQYAAWYRGGKFLYGGNDGVPASVKVDHIIPESSDELEYYQLVATWKGVHPERVEDPLA